MPCAAPSSSASTRPSPPPAMTTPPHSASTPPLPSLTPPAVSQPPYTAADHAGPPLLPTRARHAHAHRATASTRPLRHALHSPAPPRARPRRPHRHPRLLPLPRPPSSERWPPVLENGRPLAPHRVLPDPRRLLPPHPSPLAQPTHVHQLRLDLVAVDQIQHRRASPVPRLSEPAACSGGKPRCACHAGEIA